MFGNSLPHHSEPSLSLNSCFFFYLPKRKTIITSKHFDFCSSFVIPPTPIFRSFIKRLKLFFKDFVSQKLTTKISRCRTKPENTSTFTSPENAPHPTGLSEPVIMHLCRYVSLIFNQAGYPNPRTGMGSDKIRYSDIWAGAVV